jgi:hypothetical protein
MRKLEKHCELIFSAANYSKPITKLQYSELREYCTNFMTCDSTTRPETTLAHISQQDEVNVQVCTCISLMSVSMQGGRHANLFNVVVAGILLSNLADVNNT